MADGDVVVKNAYGALETVPAGDAAQMVDEGAYSYATPEEQEQDAMRQEFGGALGTAGAVAAGYLNDQTLGGSTALVSMLPGGARTLRGLEAVNPNAYMLGQAGALLGAGAASMGARGLKVAVSPAAAAMRLGLGAERALGGRALGMAAGAATEGALFGVGSAVKELALDDSPVTGDKAAAALMSHVGGGALIGGVLGGGIGLAGRAIGAATPHARKFLGKASDAGINAVDRTVSTVAGKRPGYLKSLLGKADDGSGRMRFEVALDAGAEKARIADETGETLQRLFTDEQAISYAVRGKNRLKQISSRIKPGYEAEQVLGSQAALGSMRGELRSIVDEPLAYSKKARKEAKDLLRKVEATEARIARHVEAGDPKTTLKAYQLVDDLKSYAWDASSVIKREGGRAASEGAAAMRNVWGSARDFLEDTKVWGEAADFQRGINSATSNLLEQGRYQKFVSKFLKEKKGGGYDFKSGEWATFMRNPNSNAASKVEMQEIAREIMVKGDEYAQAVGKHATLSPSERQAIKRMTKDRDSVLKGLDRAKHVDELQSQFYSLGGASDAASLIGGVGLGGLLGDGEGAMIGGALSAMANPGVQMRRAATMLKLARSVDAKTVSGVKRFFSRATRRAVPTASRAATVEREQKRRKKMDVRQRELETIDRNKDHVREEVQRNLAPLISQAPVAGEQMVSKYMEANEWLMTKLPVANRFLDRVPGMRAPTAARSEVLAFEKYDQAVNDPLSMPRLLASGDLSPQHIEALEQVHPVQYEQMQQDALNEIVEMEAADKALRFSDAAYVSLRLDIPTHPFLEPKMIALLQQGYTQDGSAPSGAPPKRGKSIDLAGSASALRTKSQQLEEHDE